MGTYGEATYGEVAYGEGSIATYASTVRDDAPWGFWLQGETGLSTAAIDSGSNGASFAYASGVTGRKATVLSDGGTSVAGPGDNEIARLFSIPSGLTGANVTIACWVNIPAANVKGPFVHIGTYSTNGWGVGVGGTTMDNTGKQLILLNESIAWIQTGHNLSTGWHHIMVTRSAANLFTAYVDGVSVYSSTFTPNAATGSVTVGGTTNTVRSLSSAVDIDDVSIYASTLSSARATAHYNGGSGSASQIAADSPVIWLKLDEAMSSADLSGNNRILGYTGGATGNQPGPASGYKAVEWSSAAGYARCPVLIAQPTTGTLECWVKYSGNPAATTQLMTWGGAGGVGPAFGLALKTDGKIELTLYSGGAVSISSPSALSTGVWHHIVGSVGPAGAKLRIDKTTVVSSGTTSVTSAASGYLHVRSSGPNGYTGTGALEMAAPAVWYNTQLSDADTDAHYDMMIVIAIEIAGEAFTSVATMLGGEIIGTVLAGEAFSASAVMLDGEPEIIVPLPEEEGEATVSMFSNVGVGALTPDHRPTVTMQENVGIVLPTTAVVEVPQLGWGQPMVPGESVRVLLASAVPAESLFENVVE